MVTRSYCASVEWSPSAVSQGGSCISGGLLFNRWRVPTSLGAAWPDPKNAMPQPPNNAVATRNKWRVTKGKAMPAVTIVDRAITPAVEKTAVDEGLEARKSPQRGRQTPQRPNDAKAHSIARRGGADLTSQTRAKSARRPKGKAHVGTSRDPNLTGHERSVRVTQGLPQSGWLANQLGRAGHASCFAGCAGFAISRRKHTHTPQKIPVKAAISETSEMPGE